MAGKVAFVTGAGTGIGRAAAVAFAREGANVVVMGRSEAPLRESAGLIEAEGGRALAVVADVSRAEEVKEALAETMRVFGRLDYAFNNAGVEQPSMALADIPEEEWARIMSTDLYGVFICMKYQIPLMQRQGSGVIVNTSSGAGVKGFKGQGAYAAAKHGVIGLSKSAALDYAASNIRINAVCPGMVDTPMMDRFTGGTAAGRKAAIDQEPVGRAGRPEEIGATVVWLCSEASSFITGAAIVADGGQTA
jgi:NAD(P)-dependent dehydrogenase (short-subunit alcohol dehydrogenase family)